MADLFNVYQINLSETVIPGRPAGPDPESTNTDVSMFSRAVFMDFGFADCVRAPEWRASEEG
ncbi:MAG TPA: hypothetical protein VJR70_11125 [Stellaceae bacterium]|nr:hypothetical protein [Stellaceae bacterium]